MHLALAVVLIQILLLLWRAQVVIGLDEQPATLLVLDVGANLPQLLLT